MALCVTSTRLQEIAGIVLIAAGLVFAGYGYYLPAKAALARLLVARAWEAAPGDGPAPRPWPWADTRPVARIGMPKRDVSVLVLAGGHGPALPYGAALVDGTATPGGPGHSVIAASRERQFAFLRHIRIGDPIEVERPGGVKVAYVVVEKKILDVRKQKIEIEPAADFLTLVTCYPFSDWNPKGPFRYVVTAVADPA
ncbi:class GN sortase [Thalassospiraceae bacterium LMO-JJ14]|nr:class GN sortase [Thalassospiraceae bacterium LMO-JJ14]